MFEHRIPWKFFVVIVYDFQGGGFFMCIYASIMSFATHSNIKDKNVCEYVFLFSIKNSSLQKKVLSRFRRQKFYFKRNLSTKFCNVFVFDFVLVK